MATRWSVMLVVVLAISVATVFAGRHFSRNETTLLVGGHSFRVLLADDPHERQQGLSGTPTLSDDTVMLFVFPTDDQHGIWMKDMRFAIDIIWLDGAGRIVHIEEGITPETYPSVFTPDVPARYVVEMNAGTVSRFGIVEGQYMEAWPSG